jgi:hypothetical protein
MNRTNDRQAPPHVAQRRAVAQMNWDQCMTEYTKKGICPNYAAMLEKRMEEHQAQFDADRIFNASKNYGLF